MSTIIERNLFALDTLKIVLLRKCEVILGNNFAEVDVVVNNSVINVDLYIFKRIHLPKDKLVFIDECVKTFCPDINYVINWIPVTNEKEYPKYYFLLFYSKYFTHKVPAFSVLTKLEKLKLPSSIQGLHVRVKGKRGARKDHKTLTIGRVSKHSSVYGKLKYYSGRIETPMGIMGIEITLMR